MKCTDIKLWLLFALVGGSAYTLSAQQLERAVISTAGDYQSNPIVGNLHWTVGEVIVEEFRNEQVLSQGFQQGTDDVVTAVAGETAYGETTTVKVFPNPTSGWAKLKTDLHATLEVVLTDLLGRHLFTQSATLSGEVIDLQPLPAGTYLLRVSREGQLLRIFRIQKVDN
jgi:hypothetical protein